MTKSECEKEGGEWTEAGFCEHAPSLYENEKRDNELKKELYCSDKAVELGSHLVEEGTITDLNELQYFYEKPWKWAPEWEEYLKKRPTPYSAELGKVAEDMLKTIGWKDYAEDVFESFDVGEDIGEGRHERIKKVLDVYPKADYMDISRFFDGPCEEKKWREKEQARRKAKAWREY